MYEVMGVARNRTFRVLWMLEELGEPYTFTELMPRTDECCAVNPSGKVPILKTDAGNITDSVAILTYLADKHSQLTAPAGTFERARQDAMTLFAVDEIEGALWSISQHKFVLPKEMRIAEMRAVGEHVLTRGLSSLEARLTENGSARAFASGASFSVPDIILGHCAMWMGAIKFEPPTGVVGDYFARVLDRPAVAKLNGVYPTRR